MLIFILSIVVGLVFLVWSADKFIDGSTDVAKYYKMPPLLIGMVIVGFGTSAPEMVVSAMSAYQGNAGIALGNAYGSNITNIALILGLTALLVPISVHSQILKKELPILTFVTLLTVWLIADYELSKSDTIILLVVFAGLMIWTVISGKKSSEDAFGLEVEEELEKAPKAPIKKSVIKMIFGLLLLILSSRLLVYGAVELATSLGVSDIIIGLTIVAIGTSLPELASSIIAARKGEPDIALGNILGSNLFNSLAVVGIAGLVSPVPLTIDKEIFYRDIGSMTILTLSLFVFGYGFRKQGRINRIEGGILLASFAAYTVYLISGQ